MPQKNTTRLFVEDSYYHIYNRGWNKQAIFRDEEDYDFFESLFVRHLSPEQKSDMQGRPYKHLRDSVQLNVYCLMPNHFHLLVHQEVAYGVTELMLSMMTAYTVYFNKKYRQKGTLFESRYKAVRIEDDAQFMHVSRYIHLNHYDYRVWSHSSFEDYLYGAREWLDIAPILEQFPSREKYAEFTSDYEEMQRGLERLKKQLADS
ncbi:hypothetical protein EYC58_02210 [Candidatus Saccharibacteria bacterium]|nr:MAG: hypothetical protein EYC58_02210 [Candidatus Saccharibacteria bacterium]